MPEDMQQDRQRGDYGSAPVPDPTVLTTEALQREILALRQLLELRVTALKDELTSILNGQIEVLEERLQGIDRATELRLKDIIGIPEQIEEKVSHLGTLVDERFASVATQFAERDTRQERETRDNTVKVDAAFAAAKEASAKQDEANQKAIDKAEQQTTEKITKQGELLQTTTDALSDKITDLRDRLNVVEQRRVGRQEQNTESRATFQPFQIVIASVLGSGVVAGLTVLATHH